MYSIFSNFLLLVCISDCMYNHFFCFVFCHQWSDCDQLQIKISCLYRTFLTSSSDCWWHGLQRAYKACTGSHGWQVSIWWEVQRKLENIGHHIDITKHIGHPAKIAKIDKRTRKNIREGAKRLPHGGTFYMWEQSLTILIVWAMAKQWGKKCYGQKKTM